MSLESGAASAAMRCSKGQGTSPVSALEATTELTCEAGRGSPPFARKSWGAFLAALYPLLAVAPLAIFAVLNPRSDHPRVAEIGIDCAVVGFTIVALQFVIAARLSWIESPFGLDLLLAFHRAMGLVATALLCAHPLLVGSAEGWSLLTRLHVAWYIWAGRVTLLLLLLQVTASLFRRAMRLSYERWRRIHNLLAVTILGLGFAHSLTVGDNARGGGLLVWVAVVTIAFGYWLYSRVVRPRLLLHHPFRVTAINAEAPNVWTVTLKSRENRPFVFAPGQFQFLRLHGANVPAEEHPFSIASSAEQTGSISLTVKDSGDFTAAISRIRPGDCATVHGPFGRFSHTLHRGEGELVFIAGGVGITPLMSMLRTMRDRREPRSVLLLYANRRRADALFLEELNAIEAGANPILKVVHVLSNAPPSWTGEIGRLDADRVARLCGGVENKSFYLCCPGPMMAALMRGLRRMGVSPRRIHADYFSL
jgi:predicted ferric reductase